MIRRPYSDADLPRLQASLAAWTRDAGGCGYCHVGDLVHRIAGLRGSRPIGELVQLWERDGSILGVALCFLFETAFDLFVCPPCRGGDLERVMLTSAYETTLGLVRGSGRGDTTVLSDVFRCDAPRRALLSRLGFEEYRLWDHVTECGLAEQPLAPRLPAGFTIRPATLADYGQLAVARNEAFGSGWSPEQYRDEVMLRPGYAPERELVVVDPVGTIAAFTVTWLDEVNRVGLFEPVGTRPRFQRLGLARALMLAGMAELRRLGMETARVQHDAANAAAGALYASLGFVRRYETLGYRRV